MLLSVGGEAENQNLLRPFEGTLYGFFPIEGFLPLTEPMLELVILADSGDCPHEALRHPDGHFHTGDLFQEVQPGNYVGRGRNDDWIKNDKGLRCDTRYVRTSLHTLINCDPINLE